MLVPCHTLEIIIVGMNKHNTISIFNINFGHLSAFSEFDSIRIRVWIRIWVRVRLGFELGFRLGLGLVLRLGSSRDD